MQDLCSEKNLTQIQFHGAGREANEGGGLRLHEQHIAELNSRGTSDVIKKSVLPPTELRADAEMHTTRARL